jgi:hypothetical protein
MSWISLGLLYFAKRNLFFAKRKYFKKYRFFQNLYFAKYVKNMYFAKYFRLGLFFEGKVQIM